MRSLGPGNRRDRTIEGRTGSLFGDRPVVDRLAESFAHPAEKNSSRERLKFDAANCVWALTDMNRVGSPLPPLSEVVPPNACFAGFADISFFLFHEVLLLFSPAPRLGNSSVFTNVEVSNRVSNGFCRLPSRYRYGFP